MEFVRSHAGRGTLAVGLACGLIAFPPLLSWVASTFVIAYAVHHLREAFKGAETPETETAEAAA